MFFPRPNLFVRFLPPWRDAVVCFPARVLGVPGRHSGRPILFMDIAWFLMVILYLYLYFSIYTSHKMAPREHIEYVETLAHNPVSVQLWATLTIATAELCQRFDSCKKSFPFRLGLCWVRLVWRCRKCTIGEWLNHSLEKGLKNFLGLGTSVGSSSCQAVSSVSCTTLTLRLSGPPELLQLFRWPQDRHMDFWPEPDRDIGDIGDMKWYEHDSTSG